MVPRPVGARLAVPLAAIPVLLILQAAISAPSSAALGGCISTSDGIQCSFSGTIASGARRPAPGRQPPLRFLATDGGSCWYWSRNPPGLDSWNPADDQAIIMTRRRLPECRARSARAPIVNPSSRAWQVFRSFPLDRPAFALSPEVGITRLPTRFHLDALPRGFVHRETLPDGRRLVVTARVATIRIDWGDGSPPEVITPTAAVGDPGAVEHAYARKTCPAEYRRRHLDGPKCHPSLDRYPVAVTLVWTGRYTTGRSWVRLGDIDRTRVVVHDVDEVLGILHASSLHP